MEVFDEIGKLFSSDDGYSARLDAILGRYLDDGGQLEARTEGLQLMREGARYELEIPAHLAYGSRGSPPAIGPNETLHFTVDLIGIQ